MTSATRSLAAESDLHDSYADCIDHVKERHKYSKQLTVISTVLDNLLLDVKTYTEHTIRTLLQNLFVSSNTGKGGEHLVSLFIQAKIRMCIPYTIFRLHINSYNLISAAMY